jgi:hypothetical protein
MIQGSCPIYSAVVVAYFEALDSSMRDRSDYMQAIARGYIRGVALCDIGTLPLQQAITVNALELHLRCERSSTFSIQSCNACYDVMHYSYLRIAPP